MPELAEVEVIRRQLSDSGIIGLKVTTGQNVLGARLRNEIPPMNVFDGATLLRVARRAKYLGFIFDNGLTLLSHLGMSGMWSKVKKEHLASPLALKHKSLALHFEQLSVDKRCVLMYSDPRRFGNAIVIPTDEVEQYFIDKDVGYEPLSDEFTVQVMTYLMSQSSQNMKQFLMNQSQVCGLGNIYAAEVLFRARIHPGAMASASKNKAALLHGAIREILTDAIQVGGSTIHTFVSVDGSQGGAQKMHHVYGREGLQCVRKHECTARIVKSGDFDSRSTFYCPVCQRA